MILRQAQTQAYELVPWTCESSFHADLRNTPQDELEQQVKNGIHATCSQNKSSKSQIVPAVTTVLS